MRLLRTEGNELRLDEFLTVRTAPPYACLSHRWGSQEVTFHDLQVSNFITISKEKQQSWDKIQNSRRAALSLGYGYIWIDSCCIDQKSSAELTEAINSMYSWYENSAYCIAYLSDDTGSPGSFRRSQWWLRGWTLQELIAPRDLMFYDNTWTPRITRFYAAPVIEEITGITRELLEKPSRDSLRKICAAEKFSWAAKRSTTKDEDQAYSLLGMFNVQLPILYGEGLRNALWRLQIEVYRSTSDHSIFAWEPPRESSINSREKSSEEAEESEGLLATSLKAFGTQRKLQKSTYQAFGLEPELASSIFRGYSNMIHGLRVQFLMQDEREGDALRIPEFLEGHLLLQCIDLSANRGVLTVPVSILSSGDVLRNAGQPLRVLSGPELHAMRENQCNRKLLLVDTFFTSSQQHDVVNNIVRLKGWYRLGSTVQVYDRTIVNSEGLRLQRRSEQNHSTQPWYENYAYDDAVTWSYFDDFEGSFEISITSVVEGDETLYTINVRMDRWRQKDVHRPVTAGRVTDMSSLLVYHSRANIRPYTETVSFPWTDGSIIRVAFQIGDDDHNEQLRSHRLITVHIDFTNATTDGVSKTPNSKSDIADRGFRTIEQRWSNLSIGDQ